MVIAAEAARLAAEAEAKARALLIEQMKFTIHNTTDNRDATQCACTSMSETDVAQPSEPQARATLHPEPH